MRTPSVAAFTLFSVLLWGGCAHTRNYDSANGPRFSGGVVPERAAPQVLRVVSFNVNYARALKQVANVLQQTAMLRGADFVLVQETDSASTKWLAAALGRSYLYVPATWHPVSQRDYGNAILSAWPIVRSSKILLPHLGRWRQNRRVAAAATVCVGSTTVRVYATHLGTVTEMGPGSRREQLVTVLDDADGFAIAIVGGDFNSGGVARAAVARGYSWPTEGRVSARGRWAVDHIVVRGAIALEAGVVPIGQRVSDHWPVWATIRLDSAKSSAPCTPD